MDIIAGTVRARRTDLGLRQDEAADLEDVSERFVREVESGKTSVTCRHTSPTGSLPWRTACP